MACCSRARLCSKQGRAGHRIPALWLLLLRLRLWLLHRLRLCCWRCTRLTAPSKESRAVICSVVSKQGLGGKPIGLPIPSARQLAEALWVCCGCSCPAWWLFNALIQLLLLLLRKILILLPYRQQLLRLAQLLRSAAAVRV